MLCSTCSNQEKCELKVPEFITSFDVFACEQYSTNLRLPKGFGALNKALEKYGANDCTLDCHECLLSASGICSDISDLTELIDDLLEAKNRANSAQDAVE